VTSVEPPWEACKICGGDHWTSDHPSDGPAATTTTTPPAAAAAKPASTSAGDTTAPSVEEIWLEPWPDSKGRPTWVCRRCRVAANHMSWCEVPATLAAAREGQGLDVERRAVVANFRARVVKAKGTQQALDYGQWLDWAWDEVLDDARLAAVQQRERAGRWTDGLISMKEPTLEDRT
jgi:hypothetical protein